MSTPINTSNEERRLETLNPFQPFQRPNGSRNSTASTGRTEKGTHKVFPHEVSERAAKLLYKVLEGFKIKDKDLRQAFTKRVTTQINAVVQDFGFDKERIQTEGRKEGSSTIDAITSEREIEEAQSICRSLGAKLEALKRTQQTDRSMGAEGEADVRGTRGGNNLKRDRDVQEACDESEKLTTMIKKIKTASEGRK